MISDSAHMISECSAGNHHDLCLVAMRLYSSPSSSGCALGTNYFSTIPVIFEIFIIDNSKDTSQCGKQIASVTAFLDMMYS